MAKFPVNIRGNRVTPQRLSLRVGDTSAVLDVKFQLASVGNQLASYQGQWASTSSYNSGDVVLYNGATYEANQSVSSGGSDPEASSAWDLYGYITAQIDRWFEDTNQIIAAGLSMDITSVSPVVRAELAIDHTSYLPDEDTFAIHFRVHEDGDTNRYPDRDALFIDADPEGGEGYTDDELNNLFVPLSREVIAGSGLSGGGNLSQDRVLSLDADLAQLNDTSLSPSGGDVIVYDNASGSWVSEELTTDLISGNGGSFFSEDSIDAGRFLSKSYNSTTGTLRLDVDALDTDDITEGSNKYYTNERVDDRVATLVQGGQNTTVTYDDVSGELLIETAGSGGEGSLDLGEYSFVYDGAEDELEIQYSDGTSVFWLDSVGNIYARRDVVAFAPGPGSSPDVSNSRLGVLDETGQLLTGDAKQIEFSGGVIVTEPADDEILVNVQGKTTEQVEDDVASLLTGGTGINLIYDDISSSLTIEGVAQYTDSDAIDAINNDSDHGSTAPHNYFTDSDAVDAYNSYLGNYQFAYDSANDELEVQYSDGTPLFWVDSLGNVYAKRDVVAFASGSESPPEVSNSGLGVLDETGQLLTSDAQQIEFSGGVTVTEPNADEIIVDVQGKTTEEVEDDVASLLTGGTGISLTYDDSVGSLTIDGVAQYTDSDAVNAINNDADHGSTAQHNYYTDSDAVSAINNDSDHGSTAQHNYFTNSDAIDAYNSYLGNYQFAYDSTNDELEVQYQDGTPLFWVDDVGNVYAKRDVIAFASGPGGSPGTTNSRLGVLDETGSLLTGDAKQIEFSGGVTVTEPNADEIVVDVQGKTTEEVEDDVASLLTGGTGISLTYDDGANTLTIDGVAQYTDADAIDAINNDSDHGSTASHNYYTDSDAIAAINTDSDHGSTASHNYYTDSDAVSAINAETSLSVDITGDADTLDGVQLANIDFSDIAATRYTDTEARSAVNNSNAVLTTLELNNEEYADYTSAVGCELVYDASTGVGIYYGTQGSGITKGQATLLDTNNTTTGPNLSLTGGASDSSVPSLSIVDSPSFTDVTLGGSLTVGGTLTGTGGADRLDIYQNTGASDSYTWIEMWGDDTSRSGELTISGTYIVLRPGSTASSSGEPLVWIRDKDQPLEIKSGTSSEVMRLGGNEIDVDTGELYIQHDSTGDTVINRNGGNVGIGTTSPSEALDVAGNIRADGDIKANGEVEAFVSSDVALKDNLEPLSGAVSRIQEMGGYSFNWNENARKNKQGKAQNGVIAQEVQEVLPEAVKEHPDGHLMVQYDQIVPLLIEAVKEQQDRINELKAEV